MKWLLLDDFIIFKFVPLKPFYRLLKKGEKTGTLAPKSGKENHEWKPHMIRLRVPNLFVLKKFFLQCKLRWRQVVSKSPPRSKGGVASMIRKSHVRGKSDSWKLAFSVFFKRPSWTFDTWLVFLFLSSAFTDDERHKVSWHTVLNNQFWS